MFIGGANEFIGGELFELPTWVACAGDSNAVFASEQAVEGLDGKIDSSPVAGKLYRQVRSS